MGISRGTLLQVIVVSMQSIETCALTCGLSGECGVVGGQTRLVCSGGITSPIIDDGMNWKGPGNTPLVTNGNPVNSSYSMETETDRFYLVIKDTIEDTLGSYYCKYGFNTSPTCDIDVDELQALTCAHGGTNSGNQIEISVKYKPYQVTPVITVTDPSGIAVSGSFVGSGTVSGFVKQIQWRSTSTSLPGGTYTYTVQKTGTCNLVNNCAESVGVQVKPDNPVLTTNSPVKTGTTLTIECTSAGYPAPSLTLKFDGRDVASSSSGTLANGEYSVTVRYSQTVYQGDDQKQVQCVLTHLLLYTYSTATVTVYYGPTTASITGNRDVYADNNQELTLTCETGTVRPGATYTWRKDSVKINGETQTILTFTPTSTDNMAVISCVASNIQYPDITSTGSVILNVRYKPYATEVIVRSDGRDNPPSIIEGRKMTLTCDSIGNPTPSYTFSREPGPTLVVSTERTYTDPNVSRADSGQYVCTASNTHGTDSRTVNVIVLYAPDVEITSPDLEVDSQSDINLSCEANGNPSQYTFHQWKHYGPHGDIDIKTLNGIHRGDNSNVILPSPVSYQDSGIYECAVDNGIPNIQGRLVQRGRVEVTVLSPPIIPQHKAHASAVLEERTTLEMNFYSVPGYTAVDWFYNEDLQGGTPRKIYVTEGDQAVEKKVIQMMFHGKRLTCWDMRQL
ncbi:hypothetical protein ScPMuIL_003385 [Solemya velum]